MREAKVDGELIQAGPDSPEAAQCPACGGEVRKRRRKVGRDGYTYFYRHRHRSGDDGCPLRYRPTR
jgi:predicted nucleic acid-binding Zn ribbon protein